LHYGAVWEWHNSDSLAAQDNPRGDRNPGGHMHETAALHFGLGHLKGNQTFTLRVGAGVYTLKPHTVHSLARARRTNAALAALPDGGVSHFAELVRIPSGSPIMLHVTAPKLLSSQTLPRLLLTAIHIPRAHRLAAHRQRRTMGEATVSAKWAALSATPVAPADENIIVDLGNVVTIQDAAASLVFHHPEMLTLETAPAATVLAIIDAQTSLSTLAQSMYLQSLMHEGDPQANPNWADEQPAQDWQTGAPKGTLYKWSEQTRANLKAPLQAALRATKDDLSLQHQCWTVQPGISRVVVAPGRPLLSASAVAGANYTVRQLTPQSGVEHSFSFDPASGVATINIKNYYLRWLQVSVDQYGPNGEKVGSTITTSDPISPVDTIMAIPLPAQWSTYTWTFDPAASSAIVTMGGLGQPPYNTTYGIDGIVLTLFFEILMPTLFIALGVGIDQGATTWTETMKENVGLLLTFTEPFLGTAVGAAVDENISLEDLLAAMGNIGASFLTIVLAGSATLTLYVTLAAGEGAAEKAAPFIGWIADAIGAAADVAGIIETSVEVARSPATMRISVVRTMNIDVTVSPDPRHGLWPATATNYTITVTYEDGPIYAVVGQISSTTQQGPIAATFPDLPAGGTITVLAGFYSANDWLAGQGTTGAIPAQPNANGTLNVSFAIKENLVPLSATTTYTFHEKIGFSGGARVWLPASSGAPAETVSDLNASDLGNNLEQLGAITLNQSLLAIGYLWTASGQDVPIAGEGNQITTGQVSTFQAVSEGANPQSGLKFSGDGYIVRPCIAFPPPTAVNPPGADSFLLEPALGKPVMHLRALSLTPGQPFLPTPSLSFGRFTSYLDDLAIHPAGYAVALSIDTSTLQIVRLASAPVPDADAPQALVHAGKGSRTGLISDAAAIACSLDKIFVLQTTRQYPQGCIVAFDMKGNPLGCFAGGTYVAALKTETAVGVMPLDISVESKGYIYVLKYLQDGSGTVTAGDYRLDIYTPDGGFLTQVTGLAAARLVVDLWRNVFTLNYEIVPNTGRTEPSVSQWLPSTPNVEAV